MSVSSRLGWVVSVVCIYAEGDYLEQSGGRNRGVAALRRAQTEAQVHARPSELRQERLE